MLGYTSFKKNGPEVDRRVRDIEEAKERTRRRDEARSRGVPEHEVSGGSGSQDSGEPAKSGDGST